MGVALRAYRICFGKACSNKWIHRHSVRFIVFPASDFDGILNPQTGSMCRRAYEGVTLATMSGGMRGNILADLARMVDTERNPNTVFEDPLSGRCINGTRRGTFRAEYDWRRDGLRIECKSSLMRWLPSTRRWMFGFSGVKVSHKSRKEAEFDELQLAFVSPREIYLYRHDAEFGLGSDGSRTSYKGHRIQFYGPRGQGDWKDSLNSVLGRLDAGSNGCTRLAVLPISDGRLGQLVSKRCTPTDRVFVDVPLGSLCPVDRASRIHAIVRRVDAILNPGARIDICPSKSFGQASHHNGSSSSWQRGDIRVKCKAGKFLFDSSLGVWKVIFSSIRTPTCHTGASFNELVLGMYTPRGIYVYRHGSRFGCSSRGIATALTGYNIQVYGPRGVTDWQVALDAILHKIGNSCGYIALVQW